MEMPIVVTAIPAAPFTQLSLERPTWWAQPLAVVGKERWCAAQVRSTLEHLPTPIGFGKMPTPKKTKPSKAVDAAPLAAPQQVSVCS